MSKTHPNLSIRSLADLQQRKKQLRQENTAAKQAALQSIDPLQAKFSGLLIEKVAPAFAVAAGLGLTYQFFGRKKSKATSDVHQRNQADSTWTTLGKFAWPLLKTALPLLQNWYVNYQNRTNKPQQ